jgi:hypothetical protein
VANSPNLFATLFIAYSIETKSTKQKQYMKTITHVVKSRVLWILLCFMGAAVGSYAQTIQMNISNCAATSSEIQFDAMLTNTGAQSLQFNSCVVRGTLAAGIFPGGVAPAGVVFGYVGGSTFPNSWPPAISPTFTFTASTRQFSVSTNVSVYNQNSTGSCGSPNIAPGATVTLGRFRVTMPSGQFFVSGQNVGIAYGATAAATLYVNCGTTTVAFNTTGNRSFGTPCALSIPSSCNILANVVSNPVTCFGGNNGSFAVTLTNAVEPITWSLNSVAAGSPTTSTRSFTGLTAGTYTVSYTDGNNCTGSNTVSVNQPTSPLSASALAGSIACFGGSTSVAVSATGGTAPYSGTGSFSASAGSPSYTVTDVNGCSAVTSVTITEPSAVVASASAGSIACFGGSASVAVTAAGGTAPYSGTGSFSATAGTASYTVTDANGCSSVTSITITEPTQVFPGGGIVTPIACNGGTGVVNVLAGGGTAPYTGTGMMVQSAGLVEYTVSDANGCTATIQIVLTEPSAVVASASAASIACFGGSTSVEVTATGGTAPYSGTGSFSASAGSASYTVTDANGCSAVTSITITQPSAVAASATAGSIACFGGSTSVAVTAAGGTAPYSGTGSFSASAGTASYTVTDANGCSAVTSVTITEPSAVVASSSAGSIACFGGSASVTVNATGGTAPYSGTGSFSASAGTTSYTVTDANGCSAVTSVTITEPSAVVASASAGSIACFGGSTSVSVSATGGTAPYSGTGSFSASAGTASYTVTDANGCSSVTSITISEPSQVVLSSSAGSIACFGGTTSLVVTATGGTAPYNGVGTYSPLGAGTYVTNVIDANGCSTNITTVITQPSAVVTSATAGSIACFGGSATVTVTATGGTAPYSGTGSFSASAGTTSFTVIDANGCASATSVTLTQPSAVVASAVVNGTISCNGGSTSVTVSATGGTAPYSGTGSFTASAGTNSYTVTDANGCSSVTSVTITEPGASVIASVTAEGSIACFGGSTTVAVSATGGTTPYAGTGSFTVNAGTHSYTVSDANGCSSVTSITITQPSAVVASASAGSIACFGGSTSVAVTAAGGTAPYSGTGSFSASAGTASYTVTDANGCSAVTSVTITQPSAVVASASAGSIACFGGSASVAVTATGGTAPYSGTGSFSASAGTTSYTVTDANGCSSVTSVTLTEPSALSASATQNTVINCNGGTASVTISATGGTPSYTGTGTITTGAGSFVYTVTDANGCSATASLTVTEPVQLVANAIQVSQIACNGGSATIIINATGGTSPYSGTGTVTATAGSHTYTVTDNKGCVATTTIFISEPSVVNATASAGTIACNGGTTSVNISGSGGTPGYSGTGTYTVGAGSFSYTIMDANGCTAVTSVTITEPSALSASATAGSIACFGGSASVTVSATGGTAPYTGASTFNQFSGSTTYMVSDANGCMASTSVTLTQPTKVEITLTSSSASSCAGNDGSATVSASGGNPSYSYVWNTSPAQSGPTATGLAIGTYVVTATDASGCTGTLSVSITGAGGAPAVPSAIAGPTGACRNSSITYSVTNNPGVSYNWTLPANASGSSTTNSITVTFGPSYAGGSICVTATNGCGTSTPSCIPVNVITVRPGVPTAIAGPSPVCTATATYTVAPVPGATSYNWVVTGGIIITAGQGTQIVTVSLPVNFGQGSIQVTASNCIGTSAVYGKSLTGIPTTSNGILGPNMGLCAGSSATYSIVAVTGTASYTWSITGDATLSPSGNVCVVNFGPTWTSGNLTVTMTNACGSYSRVANLRSTPSQPGSISGPGSAVCQSTQGYSIAAVAGATSYTWTSPAGTSLVQSVDGLSAQVTFPAGYNSNAANICVTANNSCGASTSRCYTVTTRPAAPVVTGPTTVCKTGGSYTYSTVGVPSAITYSWSVTGGASIAPAGLSAQVNYATSLTGSQSVRVIANNACGASQPGILNVTVNACRTADEQIQSVPSINLTAFPNPTDGRASISFNADKKAQYSLIVTDLLGKAILTQMVNASEGYNMTEINLAGVVKGIYLVTLNGEDGSAQTIRVVVQ